jgi:hypothetical protein
VLETVYWDYVDKVSGKLASRPECDKALLIARSGDHLVRSRCGGASDGAVDGLRGGVRMLRDRSGSWGPSGDHTSSAIMNDLRKCARGSRYSEHAHRV